MGKEYEIGTSEYYELREQAARNKIDDLMARNAKMRAALLLIEEFREPCLHFQFNFGSNGMRDYFKKIAKEALT